MRVECPSCGQRLEIPGRAATCPNCGALVTAPPPASPGGSGLPNPITQTQRAPRYQPQRAEPRMPAWARATIIVAGSVLIVFVLVQVVLMEVRSWTQSKVAQAPPTPAAAPTPAPQPATQRGSELFSFADQESATPQAALQEAPPPEPVSPPPQPAAPATIPATTPTSFPRFRPASAVARDAELADEHINAAIIKGVEFLISRFDDGKLTTPQSSQYFGTQALCVLALLHAGEAISDERLNANHPFMARALDQLREMTPPADLMTYSVSLRAQALAFANRQADRSTLNADTRWLVATSVRGAYGYREPPTGTTQPEHMQWDNSNSQYGALGAWAAAEAGVNVSANYWLDVHHHWERSQLKNGGWDYRDNTGDGTLSMTSAGVNMLFVANEMLASQRSDTQVARPPFSPSLQAGLDWLAKGDNSVRLSGNWPFYTLYAMERAGLACGFKMFGKHDWFRELASQVLQTQNPNNGAWGQGEVDTAFTVLFLSRGRHPLTINKLHFIGAWANRPRDAARLTKFIARETERPLNWQVVSMSSDWQDWLDAPILYLSSHEAPIFDDSDFEKLRQFCMAGGLLFTHADGDAKEFNQWAELLAMKIFPDLAMQDLPPNHFIYTGAFTPKDPPPLRAVSNSTRLLMVHSPTDISKRWHSKDARADRSVFELGANLFLYATGMDVPRNRVATLAAVPLAGDAKVIIPLARLKHAGEWDPEPWAWERVSRLFRRQTSAMLKPFAIEIEKLTIELAPVAHLTSTRPFELTDTQIAALKTFVDAGGVLLIDPCGGARPVAESIRTNILTRAFPGIEPAVLQSDDPLIAGRGAGLRQIAKAQVRPYVLSAIGQNFTRPMILHSGRGVVLFSELDITSGLLGSNTLGIVGYDPDYAQVFVHNAILWAVNERAVPSASSRPATQP